MARMTEGAAVSARVAETERETKTLVIDGRTGETDCPGDFEGDGSCRRRGNSFRSGDAAGGKRRFVSLGNAAAEYRQ